MKAGLETIIERRTLGALRIWAAVGLWETTDDVAAKIDGLGFDFGAVVLRVLAAGLAAVLFLDGAIEFYRWLVIARSQKRISP